MADDPFNMAEQSDASWDEPAKAVPLENFRQLVEQSRKHGSPMCQRCLAPVEGGDSFCPACLGITPES